MRRLRCAFREWLELRSRIREEHQFHLARATEEFRALGLSGRKAKRAARSRFGGRKNLWIARKELGGDFLGLVRILHGHRATSSAWLQPAILSLAVIVMFLVSPASKELAQAVAGIPASSDGTVMFLSAHGPFPWGITASEFSALRSMTTVTGVERYRLYARARILPGISMETVQSEARSKTGHRRLWTQTLPTKATGSTGPAKVIWTLILTFAAFALLSNASRIWWTLYGTALLFLHAFASIAAWALVNQVWNRMDWSSSGSAAPAYALLVIAYIGSAAMQFVWFRSDLFERCPVCLDRLVLPITEGAAGNVLLNPAITESVCVHGHGVLVESRWSSRFRPQESPLQSLVRASVIGRR